MLSLKQLVHASKLYFTYGQHNEENKRRIAEVLQDNFKPLFGIKGKVYLIAHKHADPGDYSKLLEDYKAANVDAILKFIWSPAFTTTVKKYREDIASISKIIECTHIKNIFVELDDKLVQHNLPRSISYYTAMKQDLCAWWFTPEQADDIKLYISSPVLYMYTEGALEDILVKWMEGEHREVALQHYHKRTWVKNMDQYVSYVTEQKDIFDKRDADMATNISNEWNVTSIALFGSMHHDWIKKILRQNGFGTNSKYSSTRKYIRN